VSVKRQNMESMRTLQGAFTYFPSSVVRARMVDPNDTNLARAAEIFLNYARAGTTFSRSDAMVAIRIPQDVTAANLLPRAHDVGFTLLPPGLPNGTHIQQECDQLFGAFKEYCKIGILHSKQEERLVRDHLEEIRRIGGKRTTNKLETLDGS
jgi:hypothetical protein